MTDEQILDIFRKNPVRDHMKLDQGWFGTITSLLTGQQTLRYAPPKSPRAGSLVKWVDPSKTEYTNVVRVSFDHMYITTLLRLSDTFNIPNYLVLVERLLQLRKQAKQSHDYDVVFSIRCYMNMIFGMLSFGILVHSTATASTIVNMAREQAEAVFNHPKAFYAHTDQVYFTDITDEDLTEHVTAVIDPQYTYCLEHFAIAQRSDRGRIIL